MNRGTRRGLQRRIIKFIGMKEEKWLPQTIGFDAEEPNISEEEEDKNNDMGKVEDEK